MSRQFEAAMKRAVAVERGEEPTPEPAKPKVVKGKAYRPKTLARKICESSLYDHNPTARFLLNQLAVLAMDEDDDYPEDSPFKDDKVGWCWMAQWRMSLRIGTDHDGRTMRYWIDRFIEDGVIIPREWRDDNGTPHAEYKVLESVVDANQRPAGKEAAIAARPKRYSKPRTANRGSFTTANQPGRSAKLRGIMEEDDE